MKKILTTVSAMTITLQSGAANVTDIPSEGISLEDLVTIYSDEDGFKGSGFVDLSVEKNVFLSHDADGSGDVTLGDELLYSIQVTNLDDAQVSGVALFDYLENKIELKLGSVATTQGAVILGNGFMDNTDLVFVDFGVIAPNWFALANFEVTVTQLQPGLNVITNSAEVYGPSGSFFVSDDPTTPTFDPTMIDAYGAYPDLIFADGFEFRGSGGF